MVVHNQPIMNGDLDVRGLVEVGNKNRIKTRNKDKKRNSEVQMKA